LEQISVRIIDAFKAASVGYVRFTSGGKRFAFPLLYADFAPEPDRIGCGERSEPQRWALEDISDS
jgi:hypothetical protein